ncbi:unnamed protein product [Amoebophrya sp. A120]|nr:unnamed protein product [Amoebophrya sp. A120]|eukprot:GSA120T00021847001.1
MLFRSLPFRSASGAAASSAAAGNKNGISCMGMLFLFLFNSGCTTTTFADRPFDGPTLKMSQHELDLLHTTSYDTEKNSNLPVNSATRASKIAKMLANTIRNKPPGHEELEDLQVLPKGGRLPQLLEEETYYGGRGSYSSGKPSLGRGRAGSKGSSLRDEERLAQEVDNLSIPEDEDLRTGVLPAATTSPTGAAGGGGGSGLAKNYLQDDADQGENVVYKPMRTTASRVDVQDLLQEKQLAAGTNHRGTRTSSASTEHEVPEVNWDQVGNNLLSGLNQVTGYMLQPYQKIKTPEYEGPPVHLTEETLLQMVEMQVRKPKVERANEVASGPAHTVEENVKLLEALYQTGWNTRWRLIKRLGSGAFGEAYLVQNLLDNNLAVMKRIPDPRYGDQKNRQDDHKIYLKWRDNGRRDIEDAIDGLRDECEWALSLQKFGQVYNYASRFLFMQCYETNIPPKRRGYNYFSDHKALGSPLPEHELYVIVNFGGRRLDQVEFATKKALASVLGELTMSLYYMKLAGIVHHDLKSANIMYSENIQLPGFDHQKQQQAMLRKLKSRSGSTELLDGGGAPGAGGELQQGNKSGGGSTSTSKTDDNVAPDGAPVQRRQSSKKQLFVLNDNRRSSSPAYDGGATSGEGNLGKGASKRPAPGHVVLIDFGAMINQDSKLQVYLHAPHTPGFAPREFDSAMRMANRRQTNQISQETVRNVRNGAAFDTFSIAGVFSELLLGENIAYRYIHVQQRNFDGLPYKVDWVKFTNLINSQQAFESQVLRIAEANRMKGRTTQSTLAENPNRNLGYAQDYSRVTAAGTSPRPDGRTTRGEPILDRFQLLQAIIAEYPRFLEFWRGMWSASVSYRMTAAENMWKMFHPVPKVEQVQQGAATSGQKIPTAEIEDDDAEYGEIREI